MHSGQRQYHCLAVKPTLSFGWIPPQLAGQMMMTPSLLGYNRDLDVKQP
jgi:hypothetical protein